MAVIRDGRAGTPMPAWGGESGLSDEAIRSLVAYLRSDGSEGDVSINLGGAASGELDIAAPTRLDVSPTEVGASQHVEWAIENRTDDSVVVTKFRSSTLGLFHAGALPLRIEPGGTASLRLVLITNPESEVGGSFAAAGEATVERIDGTGSTRRSVVVGTTVAEPSAQLAFRDLPVDGMPVRLAVWGRFLYVGYFDGPIDVFRLDEGAAPTLVEHVVTIADTPNHGPDGASEPDTGGRLIGGMTVAEDGTLYVAHTDPRLNEGDFVRTGHLADLNSGMITALHGGPGGYGQPANRIDLVTGLPRNVTNHIPSGMDIGPDGWLYVSSGGMTNSGVPDESKPDPDTALSSAILRLNLPAPASMFPLVLTAPGRDFAGTEALIDGVIELWATGVRNGFGLTFDAAGNAWLTDQSNDGGSAPRPLGAGGPSGINSNLGVDHLHLVRAGDFLGQPNIARGEFVLNDGSEYETPVASPGYAPPAHVFGVHNSATGIVEYRGARFADLDDWLLVGKFSGSLGVQALRVEDGVVTSVRTLTAPPTTRNVTDIAVGPDGQIVIAEFWERRVRISGGYVD